MHQTTVAPARTLPGAREHPPAALVWAQPEARRSAWAHPLVRVLTVCLGVAAVIGGAIALHALLPSEVTDDTYAFLDWGRELRHGIFPPLLVGRTFHPVPVLTAALVSSAGTASAPGVAIVLAIAGLIALAIGVWRIAALLRLPPLARPLAVLFVATSPMLVGTAFAAYINAPFATLVVWAAVWELRGRRRLTWTLLCIAGLVRPEGWAFLVFYGMYDWWRLGRPLHPKRLGPIALMAVGPMALWLGLEWVMFGSPLYSMTNTQSTKTTVSSASAGGLYHSLTFSLALPVVIAAVVGALSLVRMSGRRAGGFIVGATGVGVLTILVLAQSKFNVPSRHFSVLVSFMCVVAAAGVTMPAAVLRARLPRFGVLAGVATTLAGTALIVAFAYPLDAHFLQWTFNTFNVERATGATLDATIARIRPRVDIRDAPPNSVALTAVIDASELVWDLGVPYNVVDSETSHTTRLFVQPAPKTFDTLKNANLTDRYLVTVPGGWRNVTGGTWRVWTPMLPGTVTLRAPLPPGAS